MQLEEDGKLAHQAYRRLAAEHGEDPSARFSQRLTHEQLFFVASAQNFCVKQTPAAQSPAFWGAFTCEPGEPMHARVDPLIQDCPGDDLCISLADHFVCVFDASGVNTGATFDACELINGCDKGLLCLVPSAATECAQDTSGCCLPMCSVADNGPCPGVGQSCVALYEAGMAPAAYVDVGVCAVPQ